MKIEDFITTTYRFDSFKSNNLKEVEDYTKKFINELFNIGSLNNKFRIITKPIFQKYIGNNKYISYTLFFNFKNNYILNLKLYTAKDSNIKFAKIYEYEINNKSNIDDYEEFIKNAINNFIEIYNVMNK